MSNSGVDYPNYCPNRATQEQYSYLELISTGRQSRLQNRSAEHSSRSVLNKREPAAYYPAACAVTRAYHDTHQKQTERSTGDVPLEVAQYLLPTYRPPQSQSHTRLSRSVLRESVGAPHMPQSEYHTSLSLSIIRESAIAL
eukprot:3846127-Rhodomonas_salina.7